MIFVTDITPAGWTFSTWGIIYTWQGAWLVYNIFLVFKKSEYGRLYLRPLVLSLSFHLFVTANFVSNIIWLFLWDRGLFWVSILHLIFSQEILYLVFCSYANFSLHFHFLL
jgi:hypothetical protein